MDLNVIKLSQVAGAAYGKFAYTYRVLKEANVDNKEEKNLVNLTLEAGNEAEETFNKVEEALVGVNDDESIILRQMVESWRESIQGFKNVYGVSTEPKA